MAPKDSDEVKPTTPKGDGAPPPPAETTDAAKTTGINPATLQTSDVAGTSGNNVKAEQALINADILPNTTVILDESEAKPDVAEKLGTVVTNADEKAALDKVSSPNVNFRSGGPEGQDVNARQLTEDFKLTGADGVAKEMKKGDWVVTDKSGNDHLVPREDFLKAFTPQPLHADAPVQKFIKTLPIQAELITKDTPWHNPDAAPGSPPEMAKAGDYWAKPKGQAPYVIPGNYFKANYVQIPGSGEYARTSITDAQVMTKPGSIWSKNSGVTSGEPGDYLITRPNGNQEILSAKKFHEQFANAEQAPMEREPLSKPKPTGPRVVMDAEKGISAEPWEKGLIIYDGKSVTVTDETNGSSKEYVEGRLARERGTTVDGPGGERIINRTYTYGDLETVRQLPTLDSYKDLLERRPELKRSQELADSMPMTHLDNSPERLALRARVGEEFKAHIDALRNEPANDGTGAMKLEQGRKLNIVLGLSGSGKSTIANEIAANNHSYISDVDEIKPKLPEWEGGIGAAATSVEAHLINNPLLAEQLARGHNLVVPVVGATTEHIEKLMAQAKAQGYEISLTLVDVPPTEAMKRIVGRLEKGGLYVDPGYLASLGNRPAGNFRDLVDKYFVNGDTVSHFAQVSNLGKTPVLVAEGHQKWTPDLGPPLESV